MDLLENEDDNSEKSSIVKLTKIQNKIHNPMITKFTELSHFIYDINEFEIYCEKVKDKNRIKLTKSEKDFLENFINGINHKKAINKGDNFIEINKNLAAELFSFFESPKKLDELEEFLVKEFSNQENRINFTCRKLAKKYTELTNKKTSKSTVYNSLKYKLGFKWKKTSIKNNKINRTMNIFMMLTFIKIIARCFYQKFKVIYVDESSIQTINNNLKVWKRDEENFYSKVLPRKRYNLLMAIGEESVVYFKINKENTNITTFYQYMKDMVSIIKERNIYPYVIVLDNLSCHKSEELYNFYINNKVNIVFNPPYVSEFNCIEYSFRDLKKILYSKIYKSEKELLDDVNKILKSPTFNTKINFNLMDTCKNYLSFSNKEKDENLNELYKNI